ncbi:hypothetical protein D3C84_658220 [compost metagenome]
MHEGKLDQLAHPMRQVAGILSHQHHLHGITLSIDLVSVFLEQFQIGQRNPVDLLPGRPAPPDFINDQHHAIRHGGREIRIENIRGGQLGYLTAVDRYEVIGFQWDIGHDMATALQCRYHLIFNRTVGLARARLAEVCETGHRSPNQRNAA